MSHSDLALIPSTAWNRVQRPCNSYFTFAATKARYAKGLRPDERNNTLLFLHFPLPHEVFFFTYYFF